MSSEVTVFVIYEAAHKTVGIAEVIGNLRKEEPTGTIESIGLTHFAAGLHDLAPLDVFQNMRHVNVLSESQDMADSLAQTDAPANIVAQVRLCDARFEIVWDLTRDDDLVPETGDLVFDIAGIITGLTDGVILIDGSRLYDPKEWGYPQLFPE